MRWGWRRRGTCRHSYLFLLPGAIAIATALLAAALPQRISPRGLLAACCLGPIAAGVLWLPMQVLLYDGIGFMLTPVYPLLHGLVTMTACPLLGRSDVSTADRARVGSVTADIRPRIGGLFFRDPTHGHAFRAALALAYRGELQRPPLSRDSRSALRCAVRLSSEDLWSTSGRSLSLCERVPS